MTTSRSILAHDLLIDHPFPGIQLVIPTDHDHHDHGHGGQYCHNWVSHHHNQLDQHKQQVIGSDGELNQVMDVEKGIEASWACEQNDDIYDPRIGSADIDSDDIHDNWVHNSSKLEVVKKMNPKRASTAINPAPVVEISTDHDFPYFQPAENDSSSNNSGNNGYNNNNGIRVCSDCNTTKTPLWRSGPKGPKSLCNACGIRQRKARRALAAAAGGSDNNALTKPTTSSPKSVKIKISNTKKKRTSTTSGHDDNTRGWHQPYKKRLKQVDNYHQSPYTSASQEDSNPSCGKDADDHQHGASGEQTNNNKRICFEEFITISLSKNAALHRVFLQDEKEAAILLMALSCGLVHN